MAIERRDIDDRPKSCACAQVSQPVGGQATTARGDIQNDGYAGINPLFVGPDAPGRIGCNDHGRRRFVQALEQGDRRAQPMIDLYSALYHVERTATEGNLDAAGRRALRQAESVPLWRDQLLSTRDRCVGPAPTLRCSRSPRSRA